MKKTLSILLALCLLLAMSAPAFALSEGQERAVIGADLTEDQILNVYSQFGLTRGSVTELTVSNGEERQYLEGLVDESVIGTKSISCVYIKTLPADSGLTVTASNITWCTEEMYKAALMTAGIYDAEVKVAAPFGVSGTAALTGIYKAYENITGVQLQQQAKEAATDELVITAELADQIDEVDAVAIVNELKLLLDETRTMTDDELRAQVVQIASQYGYTLDDATISRLIGLCRDLEGLSTDELQQKVEQFKDALSSVTHYAQQVQGFGAKVADFFKNVVSFFKNLFG